MTENDRCVIRAVEPKEDKKPEKVQKLEQDSLRKRKGEKEESIQEAWIEEPNDSAEIAIEQKVKGMRKDPLLLLNPLPTQTQRAAQKTLRQSGRFPFP